MTAVVHYQIQADPARRRYFVVIHISNPLSTGQRLYLPNWIPGSYMVRDFAKHVYAVTAHSNEQTVGITKLDKSTWLCDHVNGPLVIRYEVNGFDLSVRGAHVDTTHAFYNASSVFMCVDGFEHVRCTIDIRRPLGDAYQAWKVATVLKEDTAVRYDFGGYYADNYDELIDHPVEMSDYTLIQFTACGIPHDMMLTGRHKADAERLARDLTTLCETALQFFGAPYPMERYVFLVMVLGQGYGGLEHRASTSLHCARHELPSKNDHPTKISRDYNRFLALVSHEYFHTWCVKKIKPAAFIPYELAKESYTRQLWIFEGFTRYYEDRMLLLSGLISTQDYLQNLEEELTLLQSTPGRKTQSIAESSFDAWIKFYKPDENSPNTVVSYYTKGGVVALLLDALIRHHSLGEKSIDIFMRQLWTNFGSRGIGLKEGQFEVLLADYAGFDLTSFFNNYVHGTAELPIQDLLPYLGLELQYRPMASNQDKGGVNEKVKMHRPSLGIRGQKTAEGLFVTVVLRDSAAEQAGIAPGDCLLSFADLKIQSDWEAQLNQFEIGETIVIHGFRRDELIRFTVILQETPSDACVLRLQDQALFAQFLS